MKTTSQKALNELRSTGALMSQSDRIKRHLIKKHRSAGFTRRELQAALGIDIPAVCGRVNELIQSKSLVELAPRKCRVTGKTAHPVVAEQWA